MNVSFFIVFVAEIIAVITRTGALPGWRWGAKPKYKRWNHHHFEGDGCSVGQCVKPWECPKTAVSQESTGSCSYWSNGPWVCCVVTNAESSHSEGIANVYYSTQSADTNNYSKQTADNSWKQNIVTTTANYAYGNNDQATTTSSEHPWLRKATEKPKHIRPLGDILKNAWGEFDTPRPWNRMTEIPHIDFTKHVHNKQTSLGNMKTTNSWTKPHGTSRIIFPQDSSSITFKPKTSKKPYDSQTTTKSWIWPTKTSWGHTTASTKRTVTKTTRSPWKSTVLTTAHTSLPTLSSSIQNTTRYTFNPKTSKRPSYSQPTTKSWIRPAYTSTKTPWGYTTASTKRAINKTTRSPWKSTISTRVSTSGERRNHGWGNPTAAHPVRGQTRRPLSTNRPSSTRSTRRTTRRYQATTPLPNVNIHLCGIRDQRTIPRSQSRKDYSGHNPVLGMVHSDDVHLKNRPPYQRIVGGKESEPFSWPWVVALYKVTSSGGNRFLSAGSLINENYVLTAAHVFRPDDLRSATYVVMLGTHDAEDAVAEYIVYSVLLHPRYQHRYYYHDIALLKLERSVVFNNYVMPVCLPSPNAPLLSDRDLEGKTVTVMGWGDESFGGKSSRVLKEATFPISSRIFCNASYVRVASNRFPNGITDDMLCAGDPRGGKDACQGDSGGPLTSMENGRYTQVGIVSFGYQCGDKEFPGVYTKVARYLSWIAENTQSNDYADNDY